jgi:hypothetical protein
MQRAPGNRALNRAPSSDGTGGDSVSAQLFPSLSREWGQDRDRDRDRDRSATARLTRERSLGPNGSSAAAASGKAPGDASNILSRRLAANAGAGNRGNSDSPGTSNPLRSRSPSPLIGQPPAYLPGFKGVRPLDVGHGRKDSAPLIPEPEPEAPPAPYASNSGAGQPQAPASLAALRGAPRLSLFIPPTHVPSPASPAPALARSLLSPAPSPPINAHFRRSPQEAEIQPPLPEPDEPVPPARLSYARPQYNLYARDSRADLDAN